MTSWVPLAVKASIAQGIVPANTHALILSVDSLRETVADLRAAFPPSALHAFAAKANPLFGWLQLCNAEGLGCETASIGEFVMAERVFQPNKIIFDSPVKTLDELRHALYTPCFLNLDNFQELERVALLNAEKPVAATVGIRINPQVGAGDIGITSTGNATSKFGVGLLDQTQAIIAAYEKHDFLRMVHIHTGSQGVGLPLMVAAVKKVEAFAREHLPTRVEFLDIGGGLPVNFAGEEVTPTFADYGSALKATVPSLFDANPRFKLLTEFGRTLSAKQGIFLSRVEYTKVNGGRFIVQQHVGADLLIRQVWAPQEWKVRVEFYDGQTGAPRSEDVVCTDVAGPCCMGGDLAACARMLPTTFPGDVTVIRDVGGYAHSSFSRYNLRQAPSVYLFETEGQKMTLIRRAETVEETLAFMMPNF
jgi:diaminopimelate decarboxylase